MDITNISRRKIIWGSVLVVLSIVVLSMIGRLWENVGAGEIVIIQSPVSGKLTVYKSPGLKWQGLGKATHYKKSGQFEFLAPVKGRTDKDPDNSLPVKWNDGGHASISGSIRYDLPLDDVSLIKLQSTFGSQEAIETHLIKTNMEKAIYLVGPLMSSKESYAEKKNDLIYYIEDQASRGAYKTSQKEVKEPDPLTGVEKIVTKVEIVNDVSGNPRRQETSPIIAYNIRLYNMSINNMYYSKDIEDQITVQQKSTMSVQISITNAKRAEQDAITTAKQGEADAAKAKWEQEVIKATMVTQAEARKAQAVLDVQTAELTKQKLTLEGEGEAAKKRAAMVANGALEQKLETWLTAQKYWSEAFAKYQGNMVPSTILGGGTGSGGNALQFMEIMTAKAAKDLNLDLKAKE